MKREVAWGAGNNIGDATTSNGAVRSSKSKQSDAPVIHANNDSVVGSIHGVDLVG